MYNTEIIAQYMSLGETLYRDEKNKDLFGIVGYKLETNRLDGATYQSGIVGVLTTKVLIMMMRHVGFDNVRIYHSDQQMQNEVYNEESYREYHSVIVVGEKNTEYNKYTKYFDDAEDILEEQKFTNYIPLEFIEPLYMTITNQRPKEHLEPIPRLMYDSEVYYVELKGKEAKRNLELIIGAESYFPIIQTFKHSPVQKISFEYAKTCYHVGRMEESLQISQQLVKTINLDWRIVFMTYYLLAKINFDSGYKIESKKYNDLALRAHPYYSPALKLRKLLE